MRALNTFQPGTGIARRLSSLPRQAIYRSLSVAAITLATMALCAGAQEPAKPAAGSTTPAKHTPHHRPAATVAPAPAAAPEPQVPEMPHWPQNDSPHEPEVTWDSHGLRIAAANSSLQQVLSAVASATGAKVEGLVSDERVFGDYGPGEARDVLSQLLHGSGYNVLMIGDQGQGTPREIVLTARRSDSKSPRQANQSQNPDNPDDDQPDQPEPEEVPQNLQPPPQMQVPPPGAPRTPQQMLQELQQRQQQMQDQQQQPH